MGRTAPGPGDADAAGRGGGELGAARTRNLAAPARLCAGRGAAQHAASDGVCWAGGGAAGRVPGLDYGDVRIPGAALAGRGAGAAAGPAGLCAGVCACGPDGLQRAGANAVAHGHRLAEQFSIGAFHRRRGAGVLPGAISVCVFAGAPGLSDPRRAVPAGRADAGPEPAPGVLARGHSHGAAVVGGRHRAGADGGAGRLWHRGDLQHRHLHHRDLQDLAGHVQSGGGLATGVPAGAGRAGAGVAGTQCARTPPVRTVGQKPGARTHCLERGGGLGRHSGLPAGAHGRVHRAGAAAALLGGASGRHRPGRALLAVCAAFPDALGPHRAGGLACCAGAGLRGARVGRPAWAALGRRAGARGQPGLRLARHGAVGGAVCAGGLDGWPLAGLDAKPGPGALAHAQGRAGRHGHGFGGALYGSGL